MYMCYATRFCYIPRDSPVARSGIARLIKGIHIYRGVTNRRRALYIHMFRIEGKDIRRFQLRGQLRGHILTINASLFPCDVIIDPFPQ